MSHKRNYRKTALSSAVAFALSAPAYVVAEEAEDSAEGLEVIQVTATRRSGTVQDLPINISALDADLIEDQNITELTDIARWVPGLSIPDQGGRGDQPIILRGLNTNSSGPGANGETVATYVGDIPLLVDLKPLDIERVEVLIGPQGTLYGAGTLGGAIRYIANKPQLDETTASAYFDVNTFASDAPSDDIGSQGGFVFNMPLSDEMAFRAAVGYIEEPGYVDYSYAVQSIGTSLPDPDWSNDAEVAANIKPLDGVNTQETLTSRVSLRWVPNDDVDATLSVNYQNQEVGGRNIVHAQALPDTNPLSTVIGDYDSGYRVPEPREKEDLLVSLEVVADLDFAELTSATGISKYEAEGNRDQTDLLIRLDYSYEDFPSFTSFTRELDDTDIFTQEFRLVSKGDSALSWIAGAFFYTEETEGESREFTPNFDIYAIDAWGVEGEPRPDSLEYISADLEEKEEAALFGEVSYQFTDRLQATVGARFYKYDVQTKSAVDFPLLYTTIIPDGRGPNDIAINLDDDEWLKADDSGSLFKFNVSYDLTDDALVYFTVSEGFRIGGANGVISCEDPEVKERLEQGLQVVCAQPDEELFEPDTTTNIELGFKSTWMNNRFHLNGAIYTMDWEDAQVAGATENGQQPITVNAKGAQTQGIELSSRLMVTDELSMYATFAYTKAELTDDAPYLFGVKCDGDATGMCADSTEQAYQDWYSGKDGDRLPGSPEIQYSIGGQYTTDLTDEYLLDVNFGLTGQDEVYSKVGNRADGEEIDGYTVANFSARVSDEQWGVTFYVDNLFDEYAFTAVRRDKSDIGEGLFENSNGSDTILRNYGHYLLKPRTVGIRVDYQFDAF